jgi:phage gpG-like protein
MTVFKVVASPEEQVASTVNRFEKTAAEACLACAQEFTRALRENVGYDRLGLARKSPAWAARAGSQVPLIDSGEYMRSIQARKTELGAVVTGNELLTKFHEFGTSKMVARPHVRPTIKQLGPKLPKHLGKRLIAQLNGLKVTDTRDES